jgi:uncharacterized protein (TIGR02246 family)
MNRDTVTTWLADYGRAWERGDSAGIAALFADDGVSANNPHGPPHRGRAAIAAYWAAEIARQREVRVTFGVPVIAGDRAAAEWWATFADPDPVTYAGCLMLRFAPDGTCAELREYWNPLPGETAGPPEGWGWA